MDIDLYKSWVLRVSILTNARTFPWIERHRRAEFMYSFLLLLAELLINRGELLTKLDVLRTLLALVVNLVSSNQIFDTCLILTSEMAIITLLMLFSILFL